MLAIQKLATLSMTILGSLMTKIYDSRKEGMDTIEFLEPLRDTGKLLALLIHKQSLNRKAFIEPVMTKEGHDIVKESKIEEFLFSNGLADR
ncbi:hypothetical protein TKK_0012953 [Trichogramma kaykai]